jgi:hypothetical protein
VTEHGVRAIDSAVSISPPQRHLPSDLVGVVEDLGRCAAPESRERPPSTRGLCLGRRCVIRPGPRR